MSTVEELKALLRAGADRGVTARAQIAEQIAESCRVDNLWALDWVGVAYGDLCAPLTAVVADEVFVGRLRARVEDLACALFEGWLDKNSTNQVSNGFSSASVDAARRFVKVFRAELEGLA
jgi:hypothetical protein